MLGKQLVHLFRKPLFQLKVFLATIILCLYIYDQVGLVSGFSEALVGKVELTVPVFICHIFNYWDFYNMVLFVGFLLLLPDIVHEEYLSRHFIMKCRNRRQVAMISCGRIFVGAALYVLWCVIIAIVISGVMLKDFSMEWPHFMKVMESIYSTGEGGMSLIMLPKGALDYPILGVCGVIIFRTFLGFGFMAELAWLVSVLTHKIRNGVLVNCIMIAYANLIYYSLEFGKIIFIKKNVDIIEAVGSINIIWTSIMPFFTFRTMTDEYGLTIRNTIVLGVALIILLTVGISIYYRKGALGDEN